MLVSRRGSSQTMVGRQSELALLRDALQAATTAAQPPLVLVAGEAGVGKSRLVGELVRERGSLPAFVGQATEEPAGIPFALFRDAVGRVVGRWSALPEPLAGYRHPLTHLLAPLVADADHPDDGHEHHADELTLAGVVLVRHLVGRGPALLVLDDLHWADAESLHLLRRLAVEEELPAAVIGTYRPEGYDRRHPLARVLGDLDRARRPRTILLQGLSRPDLRDLAEALVEAPVSHELADELHGRTRGNPFFLEELAASASSAQPGSSSLAAHLTEARLPGTVTEAVLRRRDALEPFARTVLDAASVLGERFGFTLIAAVTGEPDDDLVRALALLTEQRLLEEHAPDEFSFRHALVREAVSDCLLAQQRRRIHERALAALTRDPGADPAVVAHHAHGAGDAAAAIRSARVGAPQALREGAPRHAVRLARLGLGHDDRELALLEVAARASEQAGDLAAAREYAERWADAAQKAASGAGVAEARCLLAWVLWSLGSRDAAWEAIHAAERTTEADADAASRRPRVLAVRAQLHLLAGESAAAVEQADSALALAEAEGDRRARAHALVTKATALNDLKPHAAVEKVEEAIELLASAQAEAEAIGDAETLARALNNSILPGQGFMTLEETRARTEDLRDVVRRYGIERFAAKLATIDAYTSILEGDAARARAALARSTPAPGSIDAFFGTALGAYIEAETGDREQARQVLERDAAVLDQLEPGEPHVDFALAEAALAAATEDTSLAAQALQRVSAAVPHVTIGAGVTWWDVAVCCVEAGVSPAVVEEARAATRPPGLTRSGGAVAHLEGMLHAAGGEAEAALRSYRVAARDPLGARPAALVADARRRLAELLAQTGELTDARTEAASATGLLEAWPGHRLETARALRRRLGEGDAPVHELLTAREIEVCTLLARGCSNREIAEHLFISPKTASTHVSSILAKTGLQRRTQVAAWALEGGLAAAGGD